MFFNIVNRVMIKVEDGHFVHTFPVDRLMGVVIGDKLVYILQGVILLRDKATE